jgi:DNA-binding response OmpR family regulator
MARILVVDDEPDILLLHRLNLEAAGHHVLLAADGSKALQRIADDTPDLVVLDVMMPVLDGWGVLDQLRLQTDAPPVLVVSAKTSQEDIDRAMSSGAMAYLAKPFNADQLLATVARLLAAEDNESA